MFTPDFGIVVMTGAAGRVATLVRPLLGVYCRELRLLDRRPVTVMLPCETPMHVKLEDRDVLKLAMTKAEAVIHLGALTEDAPWQDLIETNVAGTANVFAAAREAGVGRIVYASAAPARSGARPDSPLAVSKAAGELIGGMYAEKYGMQCVCLRLGDVAPARGDAMPGRWTGSDDLARLIVAALRPLSGPFRIIDAVAPTKGFPFPNRHVKDLDFRWRGRNLRR